MKKILLCFFVLLFLLFSLFLILIGSYSARSKESAEMLWGRTGTVYIYFENRPRSRCRGFLISGDRIRTAKHCFQGGVVNSAEFISNDSPDVKRNLVPPLNLGGVITLIRNAPDHDVIDVTITNPVAGLNRYEKSSNPGIVTRIFYFEKTSGVVLDKSCSIFVKDRLGVSKDCSFESGYSGMPVFYIDGGEYKLAGIYNGYFSGAIIGLDDVTHGFYSIIF